MIIIFKSIEIVLQSLFWDSPWILFSLDPHFRPVFRNSFSVQFLGQPMNIILIRPSVKASFRFLESLQEVSYFLLNIILIKPRVNFQLALNNYLGPQSSSSRFLDTTDLKTRIFTCYKIVQSEL